MIDDAMALCGSANLDGRSLFLNFELTVAVYGSNEINWLLRWILERTGSSRRYLPEEPSCWRHLGEGVVRTFAFQL